jgi:hypothetical protein
MQFTHRGALQNEHLPKEGELNKPLWPLPHEMHLSELIQELACCLM